jgi:Ca2+-binding RTX toxin-like protein
MSKYCAPRKKKILGTDEDDVLYGTRGPDRILGLAGDDRLVGGDGHDTLVGGEGSDTLLGGRGNDVLYADLSDIVDGGAGRDTQVVTALGEVTFGVTAGAGVETLILADYTRPAGGSDNAASANGNELDNLIRDEGPGNLHLSGAGGNDTLIGGEGGNAFFFNGSGGSSDFGRDRVDGGGDIDFLVFEFGTASAVNVDFRSGTARSDEGSVRFRNIEVVIGTNGDDRVIAGKAGIHAEGADGDDTLIGGSGNDTLGGDGGFDHPVTGTGDDLIFGRGGDDVINGHDGNDSLDGGAGVDRLLGEVGDDTLSGGPGNDTLEGGDDADYFVFASAGEANADTVVDFVPGTDRFIFDAGSCGPFSAIGPQGDWEAGDERFHAAAGAESGHDPSDRVIYDTSSGNLYYDADGSADGEAVLVATLGSAPGLTASDITVI